MCHGCSAGLGAIPPTRDRLLSVPRAVTVSGSGLDDKNETSYITSRCWRWKLLVHFLAAPCVGSVMGEGIWAARNQAADSMGSISPQILSSHRTVAVLGRKLYAAALCLLCRLCVVAVGQLAVSGHAAKQLIPPSDM